MNLRTVVWVAACWCVVARGLAQPAELPEAEAAREPPRALHVPPIAWPRELAMPAEGAVEVLIVVGQDGLAQLEGCDQPEAVCDVLAAALLEADFVAARVAGAPAAARVRVRFAVRPDTSAPASPPVDGAAAPPAAAPAPAGPSVSEEEYGAVARVQVAPPTAHALELEEMREIPGAFGDPFRVIDTLPGVVPVMTGLPYVYVRGAPPAATAYFYDDIQMPILFHLALGPAVVHPAMVGPIDFYPGVAPARYGRRTGGTVAGQAAFRPLQPGVHGELEVRLIDTQLYLSSPFADRGRVEIGGRYGYPGLMAKLFEPTAVVQYWDYQARSLVPITGDSELMIVALGSFDLIGTREDGKLSRDLELQFHRAELRYVTHRKRVDVVTALSFGFERSGAGDEFDITALRVGPKLWLDARLRRAKLRVGADMLATKGRIGDPAGGSDEEDRRNPIYRSAVGRSVFGAYTELVLPLAARWELDAGLRGDVWVTGGDAQEALEPRLLLRNRLTDRVELHAAFGLAYQPAVFLLPLPGVADVAIDRGLQRAIQSELGAGFELPASLRFETKLFAHFYRDMLSFEAIEESDFDDCVPSGSDVDQDSDGNGVPDLDECDDEDTLGRMNAYAYGAELMLRRSYKERVSGWLAYTLSKADGETDGGKAITPSFDVRHVGNLVLQWRITRGWHVAVRGYGQSGRYPFALDLSDDAREGRRLPPFFRGDLQLSRLWKKRWGELRFSFEWLNFTFQREPIGWICSDDDGERLERCKVEYLEFPITLPMLGVRATY
jgi:hypothetical protein